MSYRLLKRILNVGWLELVFKEGIQTEGLTGNVKKLKIINKTLIFHIKYLSEFVKFKLLVILIYICNLFTDHFDYLPLLYAAKSK